MPRKAMRSNWGSVTEIEKNKRYRIRYWSETSKGYRRASETVRGQAYDRLAELRLNHSEDAPAPTLAQVWSMWVLPRLEERRVSGDLSAATIDAYKRTWRLVFIDHRRDKNPVNTVRPLVVQSWFDEMTISHARNAKVILRLIYSECELRDVCSADIARRPYHMPKNGPKRENGIWTLDELHKLYAAICGTYLEAWYIAAAFGGARVGETLAIRNDEVELVEGVPVAIIPITKQMTQKHGVTSRLKTTQSVHASVVPGPLGARLYELAQASDDEWILQGPRDRPITQQRLLDVWRPLVEQVDGAPYRPVSRLRNSWQTFTHWELGVEREKIERMMGHKGTSVTEIHYDKPEAEMLAKTIAVAYKAHPYADNWDELGRK